MARSRITEGFVAGVAGGVRKFFAREGEARMAIQRGGTPSVERAGLPFNLVSQFGYDSLSEYLRIDQDLQARYTDAEEMDEYSEISSALDLYADDATMPNEEGLAVWVNSDNKGVEQDLTDMLHKQVLIEDDVWGLARTLCKYGSSFGELLVGEQGLVGINFLPPPTVRRVEGPQGQLVGFVQDTRGEFNVSLEDFYRLARERGAEGERRRPPGELTIFEDWELVHWRLRGKHLRSVYGHGVIDPARWIWKRLSLLEDALLIYKLSRAPARYAFYVDVGENDMERGMAYVNRVKNQFVKKKFVRPDGKLDMRHNPLCLTGDTRIPRLDGTVQALADMVAAFERGEDQWVWTTDLDDMGRVRPGKVTWAGKTRRAAQLVEVLLDNGEKIRVTPDHKMIRRNGQTALAKDLAPGDSLMPYRRTVSTKAKGYQMAGYEMLYCPKDKCMKYGHRLVASEYGLRQAGLVLHHKNFDRLDNRPTNLLPLSHPDHVRLHAAAGQSGGHAVAAKRRVDLELDQRIKEASRRNIIAYNKSPAKRARTAELNRERDQGRFLREYNESAKHGQDNVARSAAMTRLWERPGFREAVRESRALVLPREFIDGVAALVRENPTAPVDEIAGLANRVLGATLKRANGRPVRVHRHMLLRAVRADGHEGFREFRAAIAGNNHKVVSVTWLSEREDTYTLTVDVTHTFALAAGVFVCNSHDEDFWIPSRGGKDSTRIEVLQGPDYAETDTVEYHRDKLVSALKVPKSYMGFGGEATKGALSSEDIRFARTVMRIQREIRGGLKKACRVHLIAKGADVDRHSFDVRMSVPSAILELAKLEVMSATADLATRAGEILSTKWALTTLFKYSEEEAEKLMREKDDDVVRKARAEAEAQKLIAQATAPAAEPGGEGAPESGAEPEGAEAGEEEPEGSKWPPSAPDEVPERAAHFARSGEMALMERRLERLLKSQARVFEQSFDRKMRVSKDEAAGRVSEVLRRDPDLAKRLRNVESLLSEVRAGMRPSAES